MNAEQLEVAVADCEKEGGADAETLQQAKRLLADPRRRAQPPVGSPRQHDVVFGDQVSIHFDVPQLADGEVSMAVHEAMVAEKDARVALGSMRKMGKHLDEYGTAKQKKEKATAWNKVMNDIDQVHAKYHSHRI